MDLAIQYGADIAIFLHNLVFWVEKNRANGKHFHDGRYWTYNTMEAFAELYPLWSRDQIKRLIAKCRENGLLLVGEYNSDKRDRTKWYSPSDEILALYGIGAADCKGRNRQMQGAEAPQTEGENATALPEGIPEGLQDPPLPPHGEQKGRKKRELSGKVQELLRSYVGEDHELAVAMAALMEIREEKKAANTVRGVKMLLSELDRLSGGRRKDKILLLRQSVMNSWKSVFPLRGGGAPPPDEGPRRVADDPEMPVW